MRRRDFVRARGVLQELSLLGWAIGRNVRIDTRWGAADAAQIRRHAADRVGSRIHDLSCELRYRLRIRCRPTMLVRQKVDIGSQDDGDMLALSDSQLRALWEAAAGLPTEKRGIFLVRLVAQLQFRSSNFTTADLDDAVRLAPKGLIQKSPA